MATDQFNLRLRDGLDRQVRARAAELWCKPRDVVEDALVIAGFRREGPGVNPGEVRFLTAAPTQVEAAPLTPEDTAPPPRNAHEPGSQSPPEGAAAPGAAPEGGCPECGGGLQMLTREGGPVAVCQDCGWTR